MEHKQTAIIVIDMQKDYIGATSKNNYYPDTLIAEINKRIALAEKQNELIIYVKNVGRRKKEPYVADFAPGLSVVSKYIIEKERANIFSNPDLSNILQLNQISRIEVMGIDGNCCVASSALAAANSGFLVTFPLKYIGIKNLKRFAITRKKLLQAAVEIID